MYSNPRGEQAVRDLLESLGADIDSDAMRDTPRRVAAALAEMTMGYTEDPAEILSTTFPEKADEIIVVRNVPFVSLCEHHLFPFTGMAHVGYLPREKVVGLSKLARLVDVYARRFQIQERMTQEIAESLKLHTNARSVGVLVVATHACMSCRGVRKPGAEMVTSCILGDMRDDFAQRSEFFALVSGTHSPAK